MVCISPLKRVAYLVRWQTFQCPLPANLNSESGRRLSSLTHARRASWICSSESMTGFVQFYFWTADKWTSPRPAPTQMGHCHVSEIYKNGALTSRSHQFQVSQPPENLLILERQLLSKNMKRPYATGEIGSCTISSFFSNKHIKFLIKLCKSKRILSFRCSHNGTSSLLISEG